jgi:hypothetical protein
MMGNRVLPPAVGSPRRPRCSSARRDLRLLRKSDAGAIINMGGQFGLLIDGQTRLGVPGMHVAQSVRPELVEPANPVRQGLPIHAADARSVRAVHAIQHCRQ